MLFVLAVTAWAANVKLYLKDGSFHIVREYQVHAERVRFYSVERSQWEEIPLDLVDLKRTQAEVAERQEEIAKEAQVISQEEKVQREIREETGKIPQEPGVYCLQDGAVKTIPAAESKVHNNKGRNVLKVLSPIPMVSGKATLEVDGEHSKNILTSPDQEFYLRLSQDERFGIVKLTPDRGIRVVERMTLVPVTKEIVEETTEVQIFRKQLNDEGLYKLWPMKGMTPGEYAVVEYTPGKANMQVWDFAIQLSH
jgi:hypothetical protein